jgi:hypothetical protein
MICKHLHNALIHLLVRGEQDLLFSLSGFLVAPLIPLLQGPTNG